MATVTIRLAKMFFYLMHSESSAPKYAPTEFERFIVFRLQANQQPSSQ